MALTFTIGEAMGFRRLQQAGGAGVSAEDLRFAQRTDVAPEDVAAFRMVTRRDGLMIIIRSPREGAMGFHGVLPPKRWADGHASDGTLVKSGGNGIGVHPETGRIFVSDYDPMSLWKRDGTGWRKLFASALTPGASQGRWTKEAMDAVRAFNAVLRAKLQHGAQDDFTPPLGGDHPGVKKDTRFAAFCAGEATPLDGMDACAAYYKQRGLHWPYDGAGNFTGAARP